MTSFDRFYALHVRHSKGTRLSSTQLRQAYQRWAMSTEGAEPISFRQQRSRMILLGHRHFKSSLSFYSDAALDDEPASDIEIERAASAEREARLAARVARAEAALRTIGRELRAMRLEAGR